MRLGGTVPIWDRVWRYGTDGLAIKRLAVDFEQGRCLGLVAIAALQGDIKNLGSDRLKGKFFNRKADVEVNRGRIVTGW